MSIDHVGRSSGHPVPIQSTEKVESDSAGKVATESKQNPVTNESTPKDSGLKVLESQLQEILKRNQLDEEIKKNHPSGISSHERSIRKNETTHQIVKVDQDLQRTLQTKQKLMENISNFRKDFHHLTSEIKKLNARAPLNAEQQKQKQMLEHAVDDLLQRTNTFSASVGLSTALRSSRSPDGSLDVNADDIMQLESEMAELIHKTDQSIAELTAEKAKLQELLKQL